jgi:hypothetical protein
MFKNTVLNLSPRNNASSLKKKKKKNLSLSEHMGESCQRQTEGKKMGEQ